jgi:YidC/Oxa1 family membrane protein insertase
MDKRFVAFCVLSAAIFIGHSWITAKFFPPPPKPPAVAKATATGTGTATATGTKPAATATPTASATGTAGAAQAAPVNGEAANAAPQTFPDRWTTLGSLDAASPYRMLVTFNAKGGVVERVELNNPRYHEIDDLNPLGGYLGSLAPTNYADGGKPVGVRVNIVGPGTPAAAAGLKAGDVITTLNDQPTPTVEALTTALRATKHGQDAKIGYLRGAETGKAGDAKQAQAVLGRTPLQLIRPEFSDPTDPTKADPLSFLTTLQDAAGDTLAVDRAEFEGVDLYSSNWEVLPAAADQPDSVAFRRAIPSRNAELVKRYTLERRNVEAKADTPEAYTLRLRVELKNTSDKPQFLAYRLGGPTGLPVEGAWYARDAKIGLGSGIGMRDVIYGQFVGGYQTHGIFSCSQIVDKEEKAALSLTEQPVTYVGVDAMYFTAALRPELKDPAERKFSRVVPLAVGKPPKDAYRKKETDVSFQMLRAPVEAAAGESIVDEYKMFLGPKVPEFMDSFGMGAQIDYGWYDWIAIPMLAILHFFYGIVRNYGIAILMLTVLVRMCLHPLTRKQALGAQKMQLLQPEIKKLAEKYKGKREELARAQQELFRKHNYSPLAGCLPIFFQIPIFVGLYNSLKVDVELRQAPLVSENIRWASDLSAPDMLWDWRPFMPSFITEGSGIFVLGPFFNLLPCITIALFLLQNKIMMPPATDEQTAMQQKIMKYMMVFMGLMFFKVPAGLCVYFIAGSIWSICERQLLPKPKPGVPASEAVIDVSAATPDAKKSDDAKRRQKRR